MKEIKEKASALINEMLNAGMSLDEIQDELCSIATKESFKRFLEEQKEE